MRSSSSLGVSDGWTNTARSVGVKRAISAFQLANSDAGSTRSDGFAPCWPFSADSSASTWIVLPRPMSSARQAPRPRLDRNRSQLTPVSWYVRKRRLQGLARRRAAEGSPGCASSPARRRATGRRGRTTIGGRRSSAGVVGQIGGHAGQQPHPLDERKPVLGLLLDLLPMVERLLQLLAVDLDPLAAQQHQPVVGRHQFAPFGLGQLLVAQGQLHLEIEHRRWRRTSSASCRRSSRRRGAGGVSSTSRAAAPECRSPRSSGTSFRKR